MIISVTDKYRLRKLDDLNWAIEERKVSGTKAKVAGNESWKPFWYSLNLSQAAKRLARLLTDEMDGSDVPATLQEYSIALDKQIDHLVERIEAAGVK